MKSFLVIAFAFGCALGAQPGLWDDRTCPPSKDIESYIVQGEDAPDGKYPYMLSLKVQATGNHTCGASILAKRWALTAGHCCARNDTLFIYSGSNYLSKGGKVHQIEKLIIHEKYDPKNTWANDICLIKLKDPFVYGEKVQQVTLPKQNMEVRDGDKVTITGWGYTSPNEKIIPDKLQLGKDFVALSPDNCYRRSGKRHESYLCALGGRNGQGICNGDSGSPLVRDGVQVGLSSWVFLPCGCGLPDFYARVPIFVDWIKQTLGKDASELKFVK